MACAGADLECDHARMANFGSGLTHAARERRLIALSGFVGTYCGLGLYAFSDGRLMHFLSSVIVVSGILTVLPQSIAKALQSSQDQ